MKIQLQCDGVCVHVRESVCVCGDITMFLPRHIYLGRSAPTTALCIFP